MTVALLSVLGVILTCSADVSSPYLDGDNVFGQLMMIVFGLLAIIACSFMKLEVIKKAAPFIGIVAMLLLFLLCTPLGLTVNGATRWLKLGYITIRPEEAVVFAVVLVVTYMTAHFHEHGSKHQLLVWTWGVASVIALSVSTITGNIVYPLLILGITYAITLVFQTEVAVFRLFHIQACRGFSVSVK